ncbi:MAG: dihydrofolate reductase [Paludibacteraceae bacterium]|nr:dihydrofolate reductase [Paludibacteraceae bacterium]
MISIIVAIADKNNAIGRKGELLCHLPNDLRHFKEITSGSTVIMGKRTFFSLPKHPLPNRRNIVITDITGEQFEGAEAAYSIEDAARLADEKKENFIIGGGMVYKQFMPIADKLYITHIHNVWDDADTFFPEINSNEWQLSAIEHHQADEKNPYDYSFAEYERKKEFIIIKN